MLSHIHNPGSGPQTVAEIRAYLCDWTGISEHPIWERILVNPKFATFPASRNGKHHCENGGLLRHTGEVLHNLRWASATQKHNRFTLATAGLWHDAGKMEEYECWIHPITGELLATQSATKPVLATHIMLGLKMWYAAATQYKIDTQVAQDVEHCIASHHGKLVWGSLVVPRTTEAMLLHQADMLSVFSDTGINPEDR